MKDLKVIDLCCGAGGFSEGFRQAGFEVILGVDIDFLPIHSFQLNFNCEVWQRDIKEIWSLPDCDVLIGSPPCPHFSEINIGFNGKPDISIIDAFLRIVNLAKPKYWVMENVPKVVEFIPDNGTKYKSQILQANWFGLYHKRKRVFIGNIPNINKITDNKKIYPTPIAQDDHYHNSKNNPRIKCVTDYFNFTPESPPI